MTARDPILHIATRDDWDQARLRGVYRPATFAADGFIHCSAPAQLRATLDGWFAGRAGLVLLAFDAGRLGDALVWEAGSRGERERFPHVHAEVPLADITEIGPIGLDPDGRHVLPDLPGRDAPGP